MKSSCKVGAKWMYFYKCEPSINLLPLPPFGSFQHTQTHQQTSLSAHSESIQSKSTWHDETPSKQSNDNRNEDDESATIVEDELTEESSMKLQARIPWNYKQEPIELLIETGAEMMHHDKDFKIRAFDQSKSTTYWPKAKPNNIPCDNKILREYFVDVTTNKKNMMVSGVIWVAMSQSHVTWRKNIGPYLKWHSVRIMHHKLEALDSVCVRVLARKHPKFTHLNYFEEYLQTLLHNTPEFELKHFSPKISTGFEEEVKRTILVRMMQCSGWNIEDHIPFQWCGWRILCQLQIWNQWWQDANYLQDSQQVDG